MSDNKLPLSRPTLGEEEIREILDVIQSGWITSGPRVKRFEEEFARYVGVRPRCGRAVTPAPPRFM